MDDDEPKKKKRRRKNRKRAKKHADDDDLRDDDEDEDDVACTSSLNHKGIIVRLEDSIEDRDAAAEFYGGQDEQPIVCVSRLSDNEFDKSLSEFSKRLSSIEKEFKSSRRPNFKLVPNLKSEWIK